MHAEPKAITNYFDGLPINAAQLKMTFLIGMSIFFDIMDNFNFGFVAPILTKNWNLTMTQVGRINSLFFVGMFIGGLAGGFIADRIGRKKSILLSLLMFSVCSIFNGLSNGYATFLVSRFFTGIGVAALAIIAIPYLTEMLPGESRGKWLGISVGIGYVALPFLGVFCKIVLPLGPETWRLVYLSGGLGLLVFIAGLFWLKESPRWLVSKGRTVEAELILKQITGLEATLAADDQPASRKTVFGKTLVEMFNRRNLKNTLVLMSIFMVSFPAGFIFINWAPVMLSTKGAPMADVLSLTMYMSFGMVAGPFLAAKFSDRGGRKIPLVVVLALLTCLGLLYAFLDAKVAYLAVALLISVFQQALCTIAFTYLSELYPTEIRSSASGSIYSGGRLAVAFVHSIVPVVSTNYGSFGVFSMMSLLFAFTCVVTAIWGMRTAGRSLEELNS